MNSICPRVAHSVRVGSGCHRDLDRQGCTILYVTIIIKLARARDIAKAEWPLIAAAVETKSPPFTFTAHRALLVGCGVVRRECLRATIELESVRRVCVRVHNHDPADRFVTLARAGSAYS